MSACGLIQPCWNAMVRKMINAICNPTRHVSARIVRRLFEVAGSFTKKKTAEKSAITMASSISTIRILGSMARAEVWCRPHDTAGR